MSPSNRRQSERAAERRRERLAFIEQQLGLGFSVDAIADDIGISRRGIARAMYREGRPDLGRRFEDYRSRSPKRDYAKGYRCASCGGPRCDHSEMWCRRCWDRCGQRAAA